MSFWHLVLTKSLYGVILQEITFIRCQTWMFWGVKMAVNRICPKCGGTRVQLSNESSKHGCLLVVLFGIFYFFWIMIKWMIGFFVFLLYDWWMAIVHKSMRKGHVWQSKRWFSNRRRIYYCHDCGHNFRA